MIVKKKSIIKNKFKIIISDLDRTHINSISKIHKSELCNSVLDLFGDKFLYNLYDELLKENYGLIAKSGCQIVGFVTASKKDILFIKCLSKISIITFCFNIFRKFDKFVSFLILFHKIYINKSLKFKLFANQNSIELFSIAVKKKYQGRGIGKKLIKALEQKAKSDKVLEIFTKTHNNNLLNFYYKSKNANLLKRIYLKNYILNIVKWKINTTDN